MSVGCNGLSYANPLDGEITFGDGFTQYYNQFTLNTGQALLDVSAFGGTGYQLFIPGLKHLNGSASGFLSVAVDSNPFDSRAFSCGEITVQFDIGATVEFNGYIGQTTINGTYGGATAISTTWAYSDEEAPVVTWASS